MAVATRKRRPFQFEALEGRKLMAADVGLDNGLLRVEGTDSEDVIWVDQVQARAPVAVSRYSPISPFGSRFGSQVTFLSTPRVQVTIAQPDGTVLERAQFDPNDVRRVEVRALGGHDLVENRTSIPSYIYGGNGDDVLHGGSADDRLYGEAGDDKLFGEEGDDRLYGSTGNDILHGNAGNDRLYGHSGHDELFGMLGNDYLSGSSGNDLLSGGNGNDSLRGGSGTDGLLGGGGVNDIYGHGGADRFLDHDEHTNLILDKSGDDVTVHFRDVDDDSRPLVADLINGGIDNGAWQDHEIEAVDRAFQDLEDRVGNNSLLRTSWGSEYHFFRASDADVGFAGYNTLEGTIILNDNAFENGQEWTSQVTFHEIGHSWHFHKFDQWLALSDWREENLSNAGDGVVNFFVGIGNFLGGDFEEADSLANHDHLDDSTWWFSNDAEFFSTYAKTNPPEDFAESFAYVMMDSAGMEFISDLDVEMGRANLSTRLRQKFDFMDSLFDDLS